MSKKDYPNNYKKGLPSTCLKTFANMLLNDLARFRNFDPVIILETLGKLKEKNKRKKKTEFCIFFQIGHTNAGMKICIPKKSGSDIFRPKYQFVERIGP